MTIPLPPLVKGPEKRARFQAVWDQMCDPASLWDSKLPPLRDINATFGDLSTLPCIGRGRFGEVRVGSLPTIEQKYQQQLCAIKIVHKQSVLTTWQQLVIRAERDALLAFAACSDHSKPLWCSRLHYCIQDDLNLYFVMDFEPGGDLCSLIHSASPLTESVAAFYLAELALAIHTLHEGAGYAHRDIKPANIVFDQFGHTRLIDFGTARQISDSRLAHDLVGTPEYIAPEVYLCDSTHGYSHRCDWWSFGVCAYEILTGINPFRCVPESPAETKYKVINWRDTLRFPSVLSGSAQELLSAVLASEEQRMSFSHLRDLSFFECIDWGVLNTWHHTESDSVGLLNRLELAESPPQSRRCCYCWPQKPKKQNRVNIRRVDNFLTQELGLDGRPRAPWRPTFESSLDSRWFGNFADVKVPDFNTSFVESA